MNENFVNILARFEPEIKPERHFQHLQPERSQDSDVERSRSEASGKISQKGRSPGAEQSPQQLALNLELPLQIGKSKPQIQSTPGISPKQRNRYRVSFGTKILGDRLTLDEAITLAKRGEK